MDIAIDWNPRAFRGDWNVNSGDLDLDPGGIRSAVIVSLFTWRVASNDYVPPPGEPFDRHGWWGDTYEASPIGSRLWQLNRVKKTDDITLLIRARDFCREALQWLIDDGVAATVDVKTSWLTPIAIGIQVMISEPQSQVHVFNFSWAWATSGTIPLASLAAPQPQNIMPPGSVQSLAASQVTNTTAFISWLPPAVGTGPFSYAVLYRVTGTVQFTTVQAGASTSLLITGLTPNTTYDFEVTASNVALLH